MSAVGAIIRFCSLEIVTICLELDGHGWKKKINHSISLLFLQSDRSIKNGHDFEDYIVQF